MLIGKRINGRYKLIDMVGGGGMANVYLAQDMILEREVALKILRMDFNNDEEFIKRFNREAQSATSLTHPNIVSIYDVGEDGDIYYIVMEYVKGFTLKQYIQKYYPVPMEKALNIMNQITAAISHAHHNGIIHRDIKPQNILLDEDGNVKITDFGIALALSATNITQTNAVLGSVHYLSPEQARGGMANKKSDIYSLGIVMFELLTGRLPFSGESAVSIALKHLQSETPSPKRWNPDIPQSVENIILKATAKDSYYRYESVDEMEDDIRTALNPERRHERPFVIPEDMEATKAIPIITHDGNSSIDETIVRGPDKSTTYDEQIPKEKNVKKKNKEKKKKSKWSIIIFSTFIFLVLMLVVMLFAFPNFFGSKEVTIPNLEGEELQDAITSLYEVGLDVGDTIQLEDEEVAEGLVIKTSPKKGNVVKEGAKITIYTSMGQEKLQVSQYIYKNLEDVQSDMEDIGFKNIVVTEKFDENETGTITSQNPSAGSEVIPSDTVLEITVSKGQDQFELKDLTQYNKTGLDDYAKDAGIIINVTKEVYSDSIEEGLVISQSPAPNTKINKGATVGVILSLGKEEIPPKTVVKEITIEYAPETLGAVQEIEIYVEDMNRSMTETEEKFYITETVTRKLEFTVPYGQKAGYKVIRDKRVIIDEVVPYPED